MEATIGLRDGAICNVTLPGAEEAIGTRLVASRRLTPADLAEAREAQETELAAWTLAELLIHLGLADEQTVHGLVLEQALAALDRAVRVAQPAAGASAAANAPGRACRLRWRSPRRWQRWLSGRPAVARAGRHHPQRRRGRLARRRITSRSEDDPNLEMDADGFALLCAVDGAKTVAELAGSTGFTLLEAADKIAELVESGLVQVAHPSHDELYDDELDEESDGGRRRGCRHG